MSESGSRVEKWQGDAASQVAAVNSQLVRSLEAIGWNLLSVEIDLAEETARIELRSGSRHVTFDARNGRASITREVMAVCQQRVGRKGDIALVERIQPQFIGRQTGLGLRSGLRALSHYVADNAPVAIAHERARDIFRPLLSGQSMAIGVQA